MELATAGDDHKALRVIARRLIAKAEEGDMQAIQQVADRLDGRPHVTVDSSTEVVHRYVARLPEKSKSTEQWQQKHTAPTIQ